MDQTVLFLALAACAGVQALFLAKWAAPVTAPAAPCILR